MTTSKRSYYDILQVSIFAEQEVIEAAYKRLAQKYHPDMNSSANATRKMQELNEAHDVLRDPVKRAEYDRINNFHRTSKPSEEDIDELKHRAYEAEQKRKEAESVRQKAENEKESFKRHAEEERLRREKAEQELRQATSSKNTNSLNSNALKIFSSFIVVLIAGCVTFIVLAKTITDSSKRYSLTTTSISTPTSALITANASMNPVTDTGQTAPTITLSQDRSMVSEPPANPQMGNTWTRSADEMFMIFIPAGDFLMGSTDTDKEARTDEKPQHKVYLDAFWIDQTEVTNAMFSRFVEMTRYKTTAERAGSGWVYFPLSKKWQETPGAYWRHPYAPTSTLDGRNHYPVVQVSWDDALAYCTWVGGRLPTEAEWEKAARGTDGRIYPWGNSAT